MIFVLSIFLLCIERSSNQWSRKKFDFRNCPGPGKCAIFSNNATHVGVHAAVLTRPDHGARACAQITCDCIDHASLVMGRSITGFRLPTAAMFQFLAPRRGEMEHLTLIGGCELSHARAATRT